MIIVWKNYSCDTIDTAVLLEWLTVTLVALQYWSYWILEINKHKELLTGLKINFLGIVNSEWLVVMWEGFHSIVASYPAPMSLHCESALDPWIHPPPTSNDIIHGHRYLRATARVGQYLYFFFYLPEAGSKQGFVSLFWFVFVFVFVFCGGKDMAGKIGIYWKFIFIYIKTSTIALEVLYECLVWGFALHLTSDLGWVWGLLSVVWKFCRTTLFISPKLFQLHKWFSLQPTEILRQINYSSLFQNLSLALIFDT